MEWETHFARALKAASIQMVSYVPDEVTADLLTLLEQDEALTVVPVTREEEGVAVLAGGYLGGKRGALILQGSGLGNSLNALGSLAVAAQIPMLLVISERGRLGEFNPAQIPLGRAAPAILEALGIQSFTIAAQEDIEAIVGGSVNLAFSGGVPTAVFLTPRLTGGKHPR